MTRRWSRVAVAALALLLAWIPAWSASPAARRPASPSPSASGARPPTAAEVEAVEPDPAPTPVAHPRATARPAEPQGPVGDASDAIDEPVEAAPRIQATPRPRPSVAEPARPASPRPGKLTRSYVRDDAQVLTAAATEAINRRVASLGGRVEIFVVTRLLEDMALFEQASQTLFKEIVTEVDHYRVIVIFIAYNRDRDHGIISTNLGHGVWHIVSKPQCEEIFGKEDAPLTAAAIQSGIDRLVTIFEQYERSQPGSTAAPPFTGFDTLLHRGPIALLALAGGAFLLWSFRRSAACPNCGAPLKTRVSISLSAHGGRVAKKTFKCFRCGYSRRQSLLPGADEAPRPRRARPADGEQPGERSADGDGDEEEIGFLEGLAMETADEDSRPAPPATPSRPATR